MSHTNNLSDQTAMTRRESGAIACRQAETDDQLIALWLHGRPATTVEAYSADLSRFRRVVSAPLRRVRLVELQDFADGLDDHRLAPASQHRTLSAIKSLFAFGHRLGYLTFDVARPLRLPSVRDTLNERILSEVEVQRMLAAERQPRNHAILLLLYASGIRVSELCGLRWRDLSLRDTGGQMTVHGKGGKTRTILIPPSVWTTVLALRDDGTDTNPVFRSRRGGALSRSQIWRIVRRAANRADIPRDVGVHHLRHAHASHALDRGAGIHLVQATLGHASVATTGRYLHARPTESSSSYLGV